MRGVRDEDGVAAVELAIVLTLFVALLGLVAPLAYLFYENLQLGRTAGDVVRFASSRTDGERLVRAGNDVETVSAGKLPSQAAVALETRSAYTGVGTATLTSFGSVVDRSSGCPSGRRVNVALATTVDLGPFLGLLVSSPTETLRARATSCEE